MSDPNRLVQIELDDSGLPAPTPEIEQERKVAIFDLLEANHFAINDERAPHGPYSLHLSIAERRLVFDLKTKGGEAAGAFHLSLTPFRDVVRDYFQICKSYFDAVKSLPAAQIEAIDMGRRGIHNQGAELLRERLDGKVTIDDGTARRLFTLICVLHFKG
jgi:uncharacterized protein (UPF0262 family)